MASCLRLNLRIQWRCTYNRGTSVGIVTHYGLNDQGISVHPRCPASHTMGSGGTFFGGKAACDHSPPSSSQVQNGRAIPPLPHWFSQRGF
jgi:hypothetical protein